MSTHHHINYVEFSAPDFEAIKKFYGTVFGWTFTDYGEEYLSFSDGSFDGGFGKGEPKGKGGALVILYSDNLETTLAAVEEAGGAIAKPIFSFPGGRRFHFHDPAGNELAVWSGK